MHYARSRNDPSRNLNVRMTVTERLRQLGKGVKQTAGVRDTLEQFSRLLQPPNDSALTRSKKTETKDL